MKIVFSFLFWGLFSTLAHSQPSNLGAWYNYFGNKKIGKRFNIHHEVQYRNYNAIGDLEQLLLRAGVGYNLTENNNNVLVGYGFIYSEEYSGSGFTDPEKSSYNEHRFFQQFITKQDFGRVYMQHRFRFEQRMTSGVDLRWRYFLGLNIALNHSRLIDKTIYLTAYNELFIEKVEVSGYLGDDFIRFDRNRGYLGLGYKFNDKLKLELAYMNQYFRQSSQRDQLNVGCFLDI